MIEKDYTKDALFDDYALEILKDRYFTPDEKSPQDSFARACAAFSDNADHANRLYSYVSNHWFMLASPILSNGGTKRGLPISCFLNYVPDSRDGLAEHYTENIWLSSMGGGIGGYWGDVRSDGAATSNGSKSTGSIPFMHVVDSQMLAFSQGTNRRGAYASYMDISHPEIEEFLIMRKPSGGDPNRKNLNIHHGLNIPDAFMDLVEKAMGDPTFDDSWDLIDPKSGKVTKTVSAKELWHTVLTMRYETGEPYLHFIDTSNRQMPMAQKLLGLEIKQSNLCSEIILPTNEERTAVCCLSSVNLEYYDDWKHTSMVEDIIRMLDNVLQYFIENAPEGLSKAVYSAMRERSLGLGAMGFHAYLQKNMVPFESEEATRVNQEMFSKIWSKALHSSYQLGEERGHAPDYEEGYIKGKRDGIKLSRRRNMHLLAIAPNASSSIICGNTSPSVEPYRANTYRQETHNGMHIVKNKFLDEVLRQRVIEKHGVDADYVRNDLWKGIMANEGSVQHLTDYLTDHERDVFKTAHEINQNWLIRHASNRQKFVDQAQSINLFFPPDQDKKELFRVHFYAWKAGLKTLYYCRTHVGNRAENVNKKIDRDMIDVNKDVDSENSLEYTKEAEGQVCYMEEGCISCEG